MDLFDAPGKKWLAVVCRFSGYAWLSLLKKTTTAYILQTLDSLFKEYGFPTVIRSDGGPQFRSEFDEYCKKNAIKHELSSPYNPESNGLAESAVKNLKSIILRCKDTGEELKPAIAAWRNMVRADGSSPSQMFFRRIQKQRLPLLNPNATSFNPDALIQKRDNMHSKRCNFDQHSVIIADLVPGEEVLVQDYLTGLWTESATVLSMREDRHSYWVQDKHGRKFIRGRRRLKQFSQPLEANQTSYSVQTNQIFIMQLAHSSTARTLKVKLHKLPPSVTSAALENPLGINQHTLKPQEFMCIFYFSDQHYPINQRSTSKYSVDNRHWDSPIGLKAALQHYILSFEQLFRNSNEASNGLSPILALPDRPQRGLQATSSGFKPVRNRQEHSGGIIPGGVQGPHHPHGKQWISFHQNPSRNRRGDAHLPYDPWSSTLLSINGTLSPIEAPTFPRLHEEESGVTRSSVHSRLYSGRGLSRPSGPLRSTRGRGRCPNTVRLGSRLFAGHPSSTSPSPGPWVWEQPD